MGDFNEGLPGFLPDAPPGICPVCRGKKILSFRNAHGYSCKCDAIAAFNRAYQNKENTDESA